MTIKAEIKVSPSDVEEADNYIENGGLDSENMIVYSARFPDGYEMEIRIYGADEDPSWAEAFLFDGEGNEAAHSEPSDKLDGVWRLKNENGNIYCVTVRAENK